MGLIVFDEITAQPELVGCLGKRLWPQSQFGLDDGAGDITTVNDRPPQDPPQIGDIFSRSVEQLNRFRWYEKIVHLGVLDISHTLVVADRQGQEGYDHHFAVGDVAVKKFQWVGDAHVFGGFIDVVDEGIDTSGEIIGGADFDVSAGRGLGGEMGRRLEIAVARLGLHQVGAQDVAPGGNQFGLV